MPPGPGFPLPFGAPFGAFGISVESEFCGGCGASVESEFCGDCGAFAESPFDGDCGIFVESEEFCGHSGGVPDGIFCSLEESDDAESEESPAVPSPAAFTPSSLEVTA